VGGCDLVAAGEVFQDLVVVFGGLGVAAGFEFDFGQVEAGVSGQVGVGIELQVVVEFLRGQVGLSGSVVA